MADPERVKTVVSKISGLPTLPLMLSTFNRMMLNPRTSAKEVAQVIASDPAITAKVLRVVNSSFYGFPTRITTVTHAIVILGFNTIKSIVLSTSIFDVFRQEAHADSFNRKEFWKHSIGVGAGAKVIGKTLGFSALEELFIAGLLHDIGKVVLDQYLHDDSRRVAELVRAKNLLMVQAEEQVLGATHADIGSWLFERWNLSRGIVETVRCHHNPSLATENSRPVAIIHLADIVCRALRFGSGGDNRMPMISDAAWAALGLQPAQLEGILRDTDAEIQRAMVFLDFAR